MNGAGKCSPTNTTVTAISNTRGALTQETGSSHAPFVTAPSTSGIAYVSTCCTCTRSTVLTNARYVVNASLSPPASTNTCEFTAARDRTNVLTASRLSLLLLFCARTYVNTAERSHSSASTVSVHSPRTRRMIVTCDARTLRKSRACVSTVERRLRSRTN